MRTVSGVLIVGVPATAWVFLGIICIQAGAFAAALFLLATVVLAVLVSQRL